MVIDPKNYELVTVDPNTGAAVLMDSETHRLFAVSDDLRDGLQADTPFWPKAAQEELRLLVKAGVLGRYNETVLSQADPLTGANLALNINLTAFYNLGCSYCFAEGGDYEQADELILSTTKEWRAHAINKGMKSLFDQTIPMIFSEDYQLATSDEVYKLKTFYRINLQDVGSFVAQTLAGNSHRPVAPLSQIKSKTLILHGQADKLVTYEHARALHDKILESELSLIDGGPHFFNWENAHEFNVILKEFLQTCSATETRRGAQSCER